MVVDVFIVLTLIQNVLLAPVILFVLNVCMTISLQREHVSLSLEELLLFLIMMVRRVIVTLAVVPALMQLPVILVPLAL